MQVKSLMRNRLLLVFLSVALLTTQALAQELVLYTDTYQPVKGEVLQSPTWDNVTLSSAFGPSQVKTDTILTVISSDRNAAFLKLLQNSNYKELNRKGILTKADSLLKSNRTLLDALDTIFSKQDANTFLILGYSLKKNGKIEDVILYHSSGNLDIDNAVKDLFGNLQMAALSKEFTGDWLPGYIVLNTTIIQQYRYLSDLTQKIESANLVTSSTASCPYRIRLIYDEKGQLVFHHILASKQNASSVKICSVSRDESPIAYFKSQTLPAPPSAILKDNLIGISAWVDKREIRLGYDSEFVTTSINSAIHEYIYSQAEPAAGAYFRKVRKQEKAKFDHRVTRQARYLVTLSPSSWPYFKTIKMTTPSGDKTFDNICTMTFTGMKLPKLPTILNSTEQETVLKCELWGDD
jgi:hypothetical protein